MPARERAWVALGSNLGDRERYLALGRRGLAAVPGVTLEAAGAIRETPPIGPAGQGPYLNQMARVQVACGPLDLLEALQAIEAAGGRRRTRRWGARTLDLDIVRFGVRHLVSPRLTVPHPELAARGFWQEQLEELGSDGR